MRNPFKRPGILHRQGAGALPYARIAWEQATAQAELHGALAAIGQRPDFTALVFTEAAAFPSALYNEQLLCQPELEHAAQFDDAALRRHWVTAHLLLRHALAAVTDMPAWSLKFSAEPCVRCGGPHGKPVLEPAGAQRRIHFSLSHAAGFAIAAIGSSRCGVDLEPRASIGRAELVARQLHPAEQKELDALAPPERAEEFTRIWTRKEALLKACGVGLSRGLDQVYAGVRPTSGQPDWRILDGLLPGPLHWSAAVETPGDPQLIGIKLTEGWAKPRL